MSSDVRLHAVEVAVDAPIKSQLTYLQNDDFDVKRGDLVNVPLGKRQVKGVVIGPIKDKVPTFSTKTKKEYALKTVISIDEEWPKLTDPFLKWLEWLAGQPASANTRLAKWYLDQLDRPGGS